MTITLDQFKSVFNPQSRRATARAIKDSKLDHRSVDTIRRSDWFNELYEQCEQVILKEQAAAPATSVEELIEEKCKKFIHYSTHQSNRIVEVAAGNQPVAILNLGDPHLDDNGCDWPLLKHHIELIKGVPGVWCGNVGDTTNNWIGRLNELYANQSSTVEEALMLSEWLIKAVPWLYFVSGNHDFWNKGTTILKLLLKEADVKCFADHEANISLVFDNKVKVNITVRHDFKGRSMWHPNHGLLKAALMKSWGDLLIAGHTHEHGYLDVENQQGRPVKCLRVRGYKKHDSFALEKGFYDHRYGAASLTVINPFAEVSDRVLNFWDIELGLQYLEFLRSQN